MYIYHEINEKGGLTKSFMKTTELLNKKIWLDPAAKRIFGFRIFSFVHGQFHCKGSMDSSLEGRNEGDPSCVVKWAFGRTLYVGSVLRTRDVEFCLEVIYLYVDIECRDCNHLYFCFLFCLVLFFEQVLSCCSVFRKWNVIWSDVFVCW